MGVGLIEKQKLMLPELSCVKCRGVKMQMKDRLGKVNVGEEEKIVNKRSDKIELWWKIRGQWVWIVLEIWG